MTGYSEDENTWERFLSELLSPDASQNEIITTTTATKTTTATTIASTSTATITTTTTATTHYDKPHLSTPFKKILMMPNVLNNKKPGIKKRITPSVATADDFLEHQRRILEEKKEKLEQIEERKKIRNEKKKSMETKKMKKKTEKENGNDYNTNSETKATSELCISPGDYVVIAYEGERYPGLVLSLPKKNTYEIKTMTMSLGVNGVLNWRWPDKEDILTYEEGDLVSKIDPPVPINNRGVFSANLPS